MTSIVDRFLEHSRIYVFGPDETAKVFLSSADWMPRNFYRRVEVMFPIESPPLKKQILHELLPMFLRDNVRARRLQSDGTYLRVKVKRGESPFRSQQELLAPDVLLVPRSVPTGGIEQNGAPPARAKKNARSKSSKE